MCYCALSIALAESRIDITHLLCISHRIMLHQPWLKCFSYFNIYIYVEALGDQKMGFDLTSMICDHMNTSAGPIQNWQPLIEATSHSTLHYLNNTSRHI